MPLGASLAAPALIKIKGRVEQVRLAEGAGTPYIVINTGSERAPVLLGPLRYQMEQDFNHKAGCGVEVAGYRAADAIVAVSVTLLAKGRVLKLRDAHGRPLWRRDRKKSASEAK